MDWRPTSSTDALVRRDRILTDIRRFFSDRGVVEVQTPVLGAHTVTEPAVESLQLSSGAFLQTSPEYYMKRLLAAGAPSIYQMGPVFRAEERGRLHNEEFTMLEWYRLDFDDHDLMEEVADLVRLVLGEGDVARVSYSDLVGGIEGRARDDLDLAFVEAVEAAPHDRFFITDYPAEQAALARLRDEDPRFAARFELVINGVEIANGYFELGDADELRARFKADNARRRQQGQPERAIDEAFLAAMRHGMPRCAGVALGIDRLVMLALGETRLSAVMPFSG